MVFLLFDLTSLELGSEVVSCGDHDQCLPHTAKSDTERRLETLGENFDVTLSMTDATNLPKTNTRNYTSVEAFNTVVLIDVLCGTADGHLVRSSCCLNLTLHFDANNLNRLVPA